MLVSTLISLRTKDEVTLAASRRLFALADTPQAMLALAPSSIEEAIYPAGFYRTKARNILSICEILVDRYGGSVPASKEELSPIPRGIKTANLTLTSDSDRAICSIVMCIRSPTVWVDRDIDA